MNKAMTPKQKFQKDVESIERFYSPAQKIEARDKRIRELEQNALRFAAAYDRLVKEIENEREAKRLIIRSIIK